MPTDHRERLARIRRFDQLVAFLRDELDWPIASDDFEELTYDYEAHELGIDDGNAAKIQEIKRLRPLVAGQPWGVFFVKFAPKRLPVVALRRILSKVEIKARPQAHVADRPSWAPDDLLFVSSYGDGHHRQIAFAHFSKPVAARELPTLKVLGWDNLDTPLKLDDVARKLTQHLSWPDNQDDADAWREQWRTAFQLRHGEVIDTSKALSARLAGLARAIRDRASSALDIESESGPLTRLMKAFRTALLDDLDAAGFADMYAQTIAYGLLSARIAHPERQATDGLAAHMRTNPFLGELMKAFLHAGGQPDAVDLLEGARIDFDELGTSEVVELLDRANMEAVIRDFGDKNPQEDPVIHFYEHFLAAYDKEQKVSRGVFYTPRPVVSYIVRTVDRLLRSEFGLEHGLADTTTWGEMAGRGDVEAIPEGASPDQPFVQILDPATGTGTFLVEAISLIHGTMTDRWKAQGHGSGRITALWNDYVPKHLLPRLHGYELLMAPYAIAHLKIGLKLYETGYRFGSDERAQVYLTDALEPAADTSQLAMDFLPALAREAEAVGRVKRGRRFTVVIGNPPYSGISSNMKPWIDDLLKGRMPEDGANASYYHVDGKPLGEKKLWLQDDYVKFMRLSQWLLDTTGAGVHGYISNHGYLDNPTFRGMRWSLMQSFQRIRVLDLHGNTLKKEAPPGGGRDVNVFDIQQGVAIGLFTKTPREKRTQVCHEDLWGERSEKYRRLLRHGDRPDRWDRVEAAPPFHLFKPFEGFDAGAYPAWPAINEIMPVNVTGVVTARDGFVIAFDRETLRDRMIDLRDESLSDHAVRQKYFVGKGSKKYPPGDSRGWKLPAARSKVREDTSWDERYTPILYRPFDSRQCYYVSWMVDWPRADVMEHMLGENVGLSTTRTVEIGTGFSHVFATRAMTQHHTVSLKEVNYLFPLYLYPGVGKSGVLPFSPWSVGRHGRRPNLGHGFVDRLAEAAALRFVSDGTGDLRATFGPEDVLAYIYAVFHSPGYRARYEAHLKLDFPRVPLPGSPQLFRQLVIGGHHLLGLHLMESPDLDDLITDYAGTRNPVVGRVGWSNGTVWLDAAKTNARQRYRATSPGQYGFHGVPEEVWDFQIGGYQICHKWLKDRKGRTLSGDDIAHYQKIVVAVSETISIMAAIDGMVDDFGGWPAAFEVGRRSDIARQEADGVVPFRPRTAYPPLDERYVTCVPLVPLRAAGGGFSGQQLVEEDAEFEWVEVGSRHRLRRGMFVAQVVGESMEPAIPNGAWCLFRGPVEGTRQGKIVLVQLRDATDPETGQRYTVKRYASKKAKEGDSWRHEKITLKPANPDFEPIVLTGADEGELQVIAELVEVLES